MVDVNGALNTLRNQLISYERSRQGTVYNAEQQLTGILTGRNKSPDRIEEILHMAELELNNAIVDIIADSLQQVHHLAVTYEIEDLLEYIQVNPTDGAFSIDVQRSTDFSEPRKEMLPSLLQSAKTSKDGSRYKVIPLPIIRGQKVYSLSSMDLIQQHAERVKQAQVQHRQRLDATRAARQFAQSVPNGTLNITQTPPIGRDYRTASDKQDPSTQWVIPAKNKDITYELQVINTNMQDRIRATTQNIIDKYGR